MSRTDCPVCHQSYASTNVFHHVRRQHVGVHVSFEAAAACGLLACSCGAVVLNGKGLKSHQGLKKCGGYGPPSTEDQDKAGPPRARTKDQGRSTLLHATLVSSDGKDQPAQEEEQQLPKPKRTGVHTRWPSETPESSPPLPSSTIWSSSVNTIPATQEQAEHEATNTSKHIRWP